VQGYGEVLKVPGALELSELYVQPNCIICCRNVTPSTFLFPLAHLQTSNQDSCFAVEPEDLFLLSGEEREVTVHFFPKNIKTTER